MFIDGKAEAAKLKEELKGAAAHIAERRGHPPGLAVVLVGDDPASAVYVKGKAQDCQEVGIYSEVHRMDAAATASEIRRRVERLVDDERFDGILVQLPLPGGVDPKPILMAIPPEKDVDGYHPMNQGLLLQGTPHFAPCTPAGVMRLLRSADTPLRGVRAVVVGRSETVGKPMALLLLQADATVTICHSRTPDLGAVTREAEVLVVAAGRPHLIGVDDVRQGATVIDVGIHRTEHGLIGDVDTHAVASKVRAITPVPGGVGPMTRAMLLANTVEAASRGL